MSVITVGYELSERMRSSRPWVRSIALLAVTAAMLGASAPGAIASTPAPSWAHVESARSLPVPADPLRSFSLPDDAQLPGWVEQLKGYAGTASSVVGLANSVAGFVDTVNHTTPLDRINETLTSMKSELDEISRTTRDIKTTVDAIPGLINDATFTTLAHQNDERVSAIGDHLRDYRLVLNAAVALGCGRYAAVTSGENVSCANPVAPGQACTPARVAADHALSDACAAFGGLPLPAGAAADEYPAGVYDYAEHTQPVTAAQRSLVGRFVHGMSYRDRFGNADLQALARSLGGADAGNPAGDGILQLAGKRAAAGPFFTEADSRNLTQIYTFYDNALIQGATMQIADQTFEDGPASFGEESDRPCAFPADIRPVQLTVCEIHDLAVSAPQQLPAGTFIATHTYTMWSSQQGIIESRRKYLAQVQQHATFTLPADAWERHFNESPSVDRDEHLMRDRTTGAMFSNWTVAHGADLSGLYGSVPRTARSPGAFLSGSRTDPSTSDSPEMWPGLFSNGHWYSEDQPMAEESSRNPNEFGLSFVGTRDRQARTANWITALVVDTCRLGSVSAGFCTEPTFDDGTASGLWDLDSGGEPQPQPTYAQQKPHDNVIQNWENWDRSVRYCVSREPYGDCDHWQTYEPIIGNLVLPVLFERTPADTRSECYYWPAYGEPRAGNGCLPTGRAR